MSSLFCAVLYINFMSTRRLPECKVIIKPTFRVAVELSLLSECHTSWRATAQGPIAVLSVERVPFFFLYQFLAVIFSLPKL